MEVATVSLSHRTIIQLLGQNILFLIDSGTGANLISSHDVNVSQLKVTGPVCGFILWNESVEKSLGKADIKVYISKLKETFNVNFDVVSVGLTPVLGSETPQKLKLIIMNFDLGIQRSMKLLPSSRQCCPVQKSTSESTSMYSKSPLGTFEAPVGFQVDPDVTLFTLPDRQVLIALGQPIKELH